MATSTFGIRISEKDSRYFWTGHTIQHFFLGEISVEEYFDSPQEYVGRTMLYSTVKSFDITLVDLLLFQLGASPNTPFSCQHSSFPLNEVLLMKGKDHENHAFSQDWIPAAWRWMFKRGAGQLGSNSVITMIIIALIQQKNALTAPTHFLKTTIEKSLFLSRDSHWFSKSSEDISQVLQFDDLKIWLEGK